MIKKLNKEKKFYMSRLKRNFAHIKQGAFIKLKRYLLRMELGRMTWRKNGEVRGSIIFSH